MQSEIIHLWGPFSVNAFGVMIIIGLSIFSIFFLHDTRRPSLLSVDQYFNLLTISIVVGLSGARLLFIAANWDVVNNPLDFFALWNGGFSLLGAIMALLAFMPYFFKKYGIPILPVMDLVALYAPLLQSISRIGCFFAGCCSGISLRYSHYCTLVYHPTQLYSAASLFIIFLLLFFLARTPFKRGQLFCIYLFLISLERFIIDFWRADREIINSFTLFSVAQLSALVLMACSIGGYLFIILHNRRQL